MRVRDHGVTARFPTMGMTGRELESKGSNLNL